MAHAKASGRFPKDPLRMTARNTRTSPHSMPLPHRSKMNIEYTKVSVPKQLCRYHHSLLNKPPWAVISEDYGMNTLQDYVAIKTGGCRDSGVCVPNQHVQTG
jgi:hypothetical protein